MKLIALAVLTLFISGCASPSLVDSMKQRGITDQTTSRIVITGSEADVGSDIHVEIQERQMIQQIWDSIYQSRPTATWYASGYRRADFYTETNPSPVATLWINASDATHLDDQDHLRHRTPGLHALVMSLLQEEYEKRKHAD